MILENVRVKPDTRNHKGFFVLEASYKLVNIDGNGWALIFWMTMLVIMLILTI